MKKTFARDVASRVRCGRVRRASRIFFALRWQRAFVAVKCFKRVFPRHLSAIDDISRFAHASELAPRL
jgi:hypothetical protein